MDIAYGMTPQSYRSYNNWHWILAAVLAAMLLLLPFLSGGRIAPHSWGSCGGSVAAAAPVAVPLPAPVPEPLAVAPAVVPVGAPAPVAAPAEIPSARVYFKVDRYDVPADVATTLAPVVDYLKANPAARATVTGYHDPQGQVAKAYNETLAKNRALAVGTALSSMGIAPDRIVAQRPAEATGTGTHAEARRVEVGIQP